MFCSILSIICPFGCLFVCLSVCLSSISLPIYIALSVCFTSRHNFTHDIDLHAVSWGLTFCQVSGDVFVSFNSFQSSKAKQFLYSCLHRVARKGVIVLTLGGHFHGLQWSSSPSFWELYVGIVVWTKWIDVDIACWRWSKACGTDMEHIQDQHDDTSKSCIIIL